MLKPFLTVFIICSTTLIYAQNVPTDSVKKLKEISIRGYYQPQTLLRTVATVSLLDSTQIRNQANSSLVGLVNTVPGARMEERSPGSYRLSLRGSLLRSPFGIRNIRIYVNNFPLTDAGGNTYLNSIDAKGVGSMEVYKGPQASILGANTGGAVLINTLSNPKNSVELALTAGSYGLLHQTAELNQSYQNYNFTLTQGYQQSDGYRTNSALKRNYIQTAHQWNYNKKGQLDAFLFYSDLVYQTPGGLTEAQVALDPRAARPATPTLPSASQQQAAIYNRTFFGGISHSYQFNSHLKHVIAIFGTHTDFKNPFITNYEKRKENTFGARTFLDFSSNSKPISYNFQGGVESSGTQSEINNYGNDKGTATTLQAADDLNAKQTFAFLRFNFDIQQKLLIELSSSLNFFNYNYQSYFPVAIAEKQKNFTAKLMPKFAVSYLISPNFNWNTTISKGYSAPTLAEVRSSDNVINTSLQAEAGWNYETGLRYLSNNRQLFINGTVFYFNLKDAIVRRLNTNDIEYFINAGGTTQLGTEIQTTWKLLQKSSSNFLNGLLFNNSYSYSQFKFEDFKNAQSDYSGNRLTGVPKHTLVSSLTFNFKKELYLFVQHNYTSIIPLNDANTVFAAAYHLVDLKAGLQQLRLGKTNVGLFVGINNLFNQKYSLGNDLNAAGNRYYNPSAGINYYMGLGVKL